MTRSRPSCRLAAALLLAALSGCAAASDPVPSAAFDGRYVGTRVSHVAQDCGLAAASGHSSAIVRRGVLTMRLFGPGTTLDGSVGADGTLRASGIWSTGMALPIVTVLRGRIAGGALTGTATDLRCVTDIALRRVRAAP